MLVDLRKPSLGWLGRLGRMGTLQQVVSTITTTEAAKTGLNNPGNLIYVGQAGASPSSNCFTDTNTGRLDCIAQFDTMDAGTTALTSLIQSNAASGMTIAQFAAKYAPAGSGNNPAAYAQYIANATGLNVNDPLSAAISGDGTAGSDSGGSAGPVVYPPCDPSTDPTCDAGAGSGGAVDWGVVGMAFGALALVMFVSGR